MTKKLATDLTKNHKWLLHYNATKGAVDTLDQLFNTYTCKRKTNRWPLIVFYNMLDTSAYNAFVLWTSIDSKWNEKRLTKRRLFLEELGKSLIFQHIEARQRLPRSEDSIKVVKRIQRKSENVPSGSAENTSLCIKRARCKFCPSSNDNKTNMLCYNCKKHICKSHVKYYCPNCK